MFKVNNINTRTRYETGVFTVEEITLGNIYTLTLHKK